MPDVILGPAGSTVLVDLDVCAKSGRSTAHKATFRGSTTPGWVNVLLLLTVVGFLLARAVTSRTYRVTLPLDKEIHGRWKRRRRLAWIAGLAGATVFLAAITGSSGSAHVWAALGVGAAVAAMVAGVVNAVRDGLGFRTTPNGDLVLSGAHPRFVQAVVEASVEPASI